LLSVKVVKYMLANELVREPELEIVAQPRVHEIRRGYYTMSDSKESFIEVTYGWANAGWAHAPYRQ
jgi:hypothetical protein